MFSQLPQLLGFNWGMLLALVLSVGTASFIIAWNNRTRSRMVLALDNLLQSRMSVQLSELAQELGRKPMDKSTTLKVVKRAKNAVMSYLGTTVVSSPLLSKHLRTSLSESGVVHVVEECNRWGLIDGDISRLVEEISKVEGLDVVLTRDGDYILVPGLKERLRDTLGLNGRIDVAAEAQSMKVDPDELRRLIQSWGWGLIESQDGSLFSSRWLRSVLERTVEKAGYLEVMPEAARLLLSVEDIMDTVKALGWTMLETLDGRLVPYHQVEQELSDRIDSQGFIDLGAEATRFKIDTSKVLTILRTRGYRLAASKDRPEVVMTLDHIRERLADDIELTGWVSPEQEANLVGVDGRTVEALLKDRPGLRKGRDGRYVSIDSLKRWLVQEAQDEGIVRLDEAERLWGLSSLELRMLMKESGLRTVVTQSGDHLSVAHARRRILSEIKKGNRVDAATLAKELSVDTGTAEALMSHIEGDALTTKEGSLVSMAFLRGEFQRVFASAGVLEPSREASTRGLDVSEVRQLIASMGLQTLETPSGKIVDMAWVVGRMRQALTLKGVFDLQALAEQLDLEYAKLADIVEKQLGANEIVVDPAGLIVNSKWIGVLREYASERESIQVASFAKERGLRQSAALHLLRRYVGGVYKSRQDVFVPHLRP